MSKPGIIPHVPQRNEDTAYSTIALEGRENEKQEIRKVGMKINKEIYKCRKKEKMKEGKENNRKKVYNVCLEGRRKGRMKGRKEE